MPECKGMLTSKSGMDKRSAQMKGVMPVRELSTPFAIEAQIPPQLVLRFKQVIVREKNLLQGVEAVICSRSSEGVSLVVKGDENSDDSVGDCLVVR